MPELDAKENERGRTAGTEEHMRTRKEQGLRGRRGESAQSVGKEQR